MAPVPLSHLLARTYHKSYSHHSGLGGGLGGGIVGFIILLMIAIFVIVLFLQYRKASTVQQQTGRPIIWGTIIKKAILSGITLGIAGCCCAECFGDVNGDVPAGPGGGYAGGGGYPPQMQQPMPTYQPQGMNYAPMQGAPMQGAPQYGNQGYN